MPQIPSAYDPNTGRLEDIAVFAVGGLMLLGFLLLVALVAAILLLAGEWGHDRFIRWRLGHSYYLEFRQYVWKRSRLMLPIPDAFELGVAVQPLTGAGSDGSLLTGTGKEPQN